MNRSALLSGALSSIWVLTDLVYLILNPSKSFVEPDIHIYVLTKSLQDNPIMLFLAAHYATITWINGMALIGALWASWRSEQPDQHRIKPAVIIDREARTPPLSPRLQAARVLPSQSTSSPTSRCSGLPDPSRASERPSLNPDSVGPN